MPMEAVGGGDPATVTPDGEQVTGWHVQTGKGRKVLQIGQETSYLCDTYLEDGTLVTNELMAGIGQQLNDGQFEELMSDAQFDNVSRFATMTQRAIASMPTSDVQGAIEAAKSIPVSLIARLLVAKLGAGESIGSVFAGAFHSSGQWLWFVGTDKRIAIFGINDDRFVLSDPTSEQVLTSITFDEVRSAQASQQHG